MKSSSRTDESLIKRAKYGGRNIRALAILLSFIAALGLLALLFLPVSMKPGFGFELFYVLFLVIVAAFWMLSIMARQGDTLALSIFLWWYGICLILNVAGVLISYVTERDVSWFGWLAVALQLLIVVVLARNRSDLLELQRRGLSESVFGPGRPPRHLTVLGGTVLIGAQIAIVATILAPIIHAAQTANEIGDFLAMLNVEERALQQAMGNPTRPDDKQFWASVLDAAERLREKAQQVEEQASARSSIKRIATTYRRAAERWQMGAEDAHAAGRMTRQARAAFREGDDFREEAYAEFHEKYPGSGQRPK
jgi:hypothetical protein